MPLLIVLVPLLYNHLLLLCIHLLFMLFSTFEICNITILYFLSMYFMCLWCVCLCVFKCRCVYIILILLLVYCLVFVSGMISSRHLISRDFWVFFWMQLVSANDRVCVCYRKISTGHEWQSDRRRNDSWSTTLKTHPIRNHNNSLLTPSR